MKILITGANGMLGEKIVGQLADKHQIYASDLQDELLYESKNVTYHKIDVTNEEKVKTLTKEIDPEFIVNCAAYTDVDASEDQKEEAHNVNVNGVKNIVSAAESLGTHIIHISTDYVFDGTDGPYKEEDEVEPVNYYGQTKLESENILKEANIPWTIIRTNIIFGNCISEDANFVKWVIEKLQEGEKIEVVNDQFGNPTWADGLAQVIEKVIDKHLEGLYHYGGENYVSRFEFALEIADVFSLDNQLIGKITTRALDQKAKRPYKAGLVSDKLQEDLDMNLYSIKEALSKMKENMKIQKE